MNSQNIKSIRATITHFAELARTSADSELTRDAAIMAYRYAQRLPATMSTKPASDASRRLAQQLATRTLEVSR